MNNSHDGPKKKRVESPKLQPDKPTAPSTSTRSSNNSTINAAKTAPSTVSKPPDKSSVQSTTTTPTSTKPSNSVSQTRSQSTSLDNQIAAAVADEFASNDTLKPKSLQANLRMTPHRTPDPVMRQKTSNSGVKGKQAQHTDSANSSSSSKLSHIEKNTDRLTPPSRNPAKRNADAASLINSAPPAVKYTRREVGGDGEQNSAALIDTPTSSKLSNNQRRNSLPAAVKDTVRFY